MKEDDVSWLQHHSHHQKKIIIKSLQYIFYIDGTYLGPRIVLTMQKIGIHRLSVDHFILATSLQLT